MLGEHLSQFPLTRVRADAGGFGYASPGYYFLGAALQAVRRRKTSERLLKGVRRYRYRERERERESCSTISIGSGVFPRETFGLPLL